MTDYWPKAGDWVADGNHILRKSEMFEDVVAVSEDYRNQRNINARLMAAAPDLFSLLEQARVLLGTTWPAGTVHEERRLGDGGKNYSIHSEELDPLLAAIDAVLARARGGIDG
jgi:hypothetical protein